ncbi:AraC family transcriptional regulator [Paractinoplanes abujensis]|uniref:AraC family L-rhamnose operon transcriptional activator RhaR n=1 Tax=Paractinoplanes abujensis TaxID=882441 RepID=A0A7W7CNV1_9ACTN|nr:AraC family transcriptional regulator [Actinoplanes abujensis]MBB4691729.1 AraC family L-rhamnose operon transcriptional activator RhaR [Actinoplanes abujensis]GID16849.1 AraC family transcriptional regulator [Actinoplanes abujensis]
MSGATIENKSTLVYFGDDSFAYAGRHVHEDEMRVHTHSFVEVAIVAGGRGVHHSLNGRQALEVGDTVLLRPGVWHGYEECRGLELYNFCFSAELLRRELAWTRDDPLLGHLLWTGPYAERRRGILSTHLGGPERAACFAHLDALAALRSRPVHLHRADQIAQVVLALGCVARAVGADVRSEPQHPAVVEVMRRIESDPARNWTLAELSDGLHLAPGYLVRRFKSVTGLPPVAFLARHRVELAAEMLLHTDRTVRAIAESVGWPDQNYFARRFRAHYGLTATDYRTRFTSGKAIGSPVATDDP